jgi:hypothetical protein
MQIALAVVRICHDDLMAAKSFPEAAEVLKGVAARVDDSAELLLLTRCAECSLQARSIAEWRELYGGPLYVSVVQADAAQAAQQEQAAPSANHSCTNTSSGSRDSGSTSPQHSPCTGSPVPVGLPFAMSADPLNASSAAVGDVTMSSLLETSVMAAAGSAQLALPCTPPVNIGASLERLFSPLPYSPAGAAAPGSGGGLRRSLVSSPLGLPARAAAGGGGGGGSPMLFSAGIGTAGSPALRMAGSPLAGAGRVASPLTRRFTAKSPQGMLSPAAGGAGAAAAACAGRLLSPLGGGSRGGAAATLLTSPTAVLSPAPSHSSSMLAPSDLVMGSPSLRKAVVMARHNAAVTAAAASVAGHAKATPLRRHAAGSSHPLGNDASTATGETSASVAPASGETADRDAGPAPALIKASPAPRHRSHAPSILPPMPTQAQRDPATIAAALNPSSRKRSRATMMDEAAMTPNRPAAAATVISASASAASVPKVSTAGGRSSLFGLLSPSASGRTALQRTAAAVSAAAATAAAVVSRRHPTAYDEFDGSGYLDHQLMGDGNRDAEQNEDGEGSAGRAAKRLRGEGVALAADEDVAASAADASSDEEDEVDAPSGGAEAPQPSAVRQEQARARKVLADVELLSPRRMGASVGAGNSRKDGTCTSALPGGRGRQAVQMMMLSPPRRGAPPASGVLGYAANLGVDAEN